jgi:hypothetical protein
VIEVLLQFANLMPQLAQTETIMGHMEKHSAITTLLADEVIITKIIIRQIRIHINMEAWKWLKNRAKLNNLVLPKLLMGINMAFIINK